MQPSMGARRKREQARGRCGWGMGSPVPAARNGREADAGAKRSKSTVAVQYTCTGLWQWLSQWRIAWQHITIASSQPRRLAPCPLRHMQAM